MASTGPSQASEAATPLDARGNFLATLLDGDADISVEQLNDLQGTRDKVDYRLDNASPGTHKPGDPNRTPSDQRAMEVWERTPLVAG